MRIERVDALGFGPLTDARLEFAEGMTLVFGPNEAGKSSWHGALYAGVCGVRRTRGRRSSSDEEFEMRHRPWGGGPWQVQAVVGLADGRRFELTQDLSAREGSARDHATGREVTREILTEQTPDASRWLGLDREAFRAVACVPQTALLQILDQPGQLAGHLQRAAATAGTDATAAEAIRRIETFLAEQVGTDRAYTKPLVKAKQELQAAEAALRRAEQAHADMTHLQEELHAARREQVLAAHRLRCAVAADARRRADAAQNVWKQAADLSARYPEPPPAFGDDDALAQQVRVAVDGYHSRPPIPALDGLSAAALQSELGQLPQHPVGDLEPAEEVAAAREAVRQARSVLESVVHLKPAAVKERVDVPVDTRELRRLADALAEPMPEAPRQTGTQTAHPDSSQRPHTRLLSWIAATAALILLLTGMGVAVMARQPLGWATALAGTAIGAVLVVTLLRDRARHMSGLKDQAADWAWKAARQRLTEAQNRATNLGLSADPKAIHDLADAADRARVAEEQWADWERRHNAATSTLRQALSQLGMALSRRGVTATGDPESDFRRYGEECVQRAQQAVRAARRADLQARLQSRQQAEAQAADAELRRSNAEQAVRAAGRECGIPKVETADLDVLAGALEAWLEQRQQVLDQRQQTAGDYAVLQKLLEGGQTLDGLHEEAERLARAAGAAAEGLDLADIAVADLGQDPVETLRRLRDAAEDAHVQVTALEERAQGLERAVPSVPASHEAVAQASARVAHLERLRDILTRAREFLVEAQERVHRSIAPQLADAIAPHLATVTDGRYTEVRVDPEDLQVRVRPPSGTWRDAAHLSRGTAEQVYLLLRGALAQYLATTGEPCPLILDDPTAYADASRTTAILQVLHSISAERQVIVFSHDNQVLSWAQRNLASLRDKLIELVDLAPA